MFQASLCPSSGDRLFKTASGVSLDVLAAVVWSQDTSWARVLTLLESQLRHNTHQPTATSISEDNVTYMLRGQRKMCKVREDLHSGRPLRSWKKGIGRSTHSGVCKWRTQRARVETQTRNGEEREGVRCQEQNGKQLRECLEKKSYSLSKKPAIKGLFEKKKRRLGPMCEVLSLEAWRLWDWGRLLSVPHVQKTYKIVR